MANILVTGATGFVGANLIRKLLQSKNNVSLILRKQSNLWRLSDITSQLDTHVVDLRDKDSIKRTIFETKPDIVYHLATYGGYPFQEDLTTMIENNLLFSVNFMEALAEYGQLTRFVNYGSSSEYGPKDKPMKENDVTEPITPYAITKVAQTLFSKYFSKKNKLPTVTLRLFSVYGPFEDQGRLICDIMMSWIKGRPLELGSPIPTRDFIYIDDVIDASEKASEKSNIKGEIFNIGGGKQYSVKEVVETATNLSNEKILVEWGIEGKGRMFDTNNVWVADITKTKKLLDWAPKTSLKDGLYKTHEWFEKNIELYEKTKK